MNSFTSMFSFYFSAFQQIVHNWSIILLTVLIWHLWFFSGLNWAKDIIKTLFEDVFFLNLTRSWTEQGGYNFTSLFLHKDKNT